MCVFADMVTFSSSLAHLYLTSVEGVSSVNVTKKKGWAWKDWSAAAVATEVRTGASLFHGRNNVTING